MKGNEHFPGIKSRNQVSPKKPSNFFVFLFLISFVLSFNGLFAATVQNDEPKGENKGLQDTPPVITVVSATRREIPIEKATRAVTVITREQIERSGKVFLLDLLRGVPGVMVIQLGTFGREAHVVMRGVNKESTLVMMDGVQINNSNQSLASLQHITTTDIERIEIIRGSQSVLYGADAVGGLINIVTKPGRGKGLSASGMFDYGTYNTFHEEGTVSGSWDKFSFSGAGGRIDTEGLGHNDDYENTTARAHTKLQVTDNSDLDVAFHHFNSIVGLDDGFVTVNGRNFFRQDPNRSTRANQQVVNTKYMISLTDWWQQYVQYSLFHDSSFSHDPRNPDLRTGADPESFLHINSNRHTFEYQSDFYISDFDVLTAGYEFEHSNVHTTNNNSLARNHGWFGQNELTLWNIWTIVAGIRLDHHELYGLEASPLVSTGLWITKTQTKIKGSFGRGFRAPTFNQLFFPNFGDPNLEPETSWSWDAGFEQFYGKDKRGSFSLMYFNNKTRNLILNLTRATNIGRAFSQGIEFENRIRLWKELYFNTTYTYTHAIDVTTDKRLLRIPRHQGKFGFTYDYQKWHLTVDWIWVGSREDSGSRVHTRMDEYEKLDLAVFYDLTKFAQLYGRVGNLTNDNYQEGRGFDMPLATVTGGIKAKI
ncbi:MAG: TonB-dependent receptor [Candidatus Omnitrophica bacterium]|nr:TonB-dependent receptor [Candidatus Omnitrophota bacterium]